MDIKTLIETLEKADALTHKHAKLDRPKVLGNAIKANVNDLLNALRILLVAGQPDPEAFETWARSIGQDDRDLMRSSIRDQRYSWTTQQKMWEAFQAGRRLASHQQDTTAVVAQKPADLSDNGVMGPYNACMFRDQCRAALTTSIPLTPAEIQSNHSRVNWAEGLIRQLPEDHDGRNSWLLNYGGSPRPNDMKATQDTKSGPHWLPPTVFKLELPEGDNRAARVVYADATKPGEVSLCIDVTVGPAPHDLYTDADRDRPDVICDSNGQVTLDLCKRCGKGEAELLDAPCVAPPAARVSESKPDPFEVGFWRWFTYFCPPAAANRVRNLWMESPDYARAVEALRATRVTPQPAIQHLPSDDSEGGLP